MLVKKCNACGVTCWHNKSGKKDGPERCTYCGSPVGGSEMKKEAGRFIANRQINRAKTLGITTAGVI